MSNNRVVHVLMVAISCLLYTSCDFNYYPRYVSTECRILPEDKQAYGEALQKAQADVMEQSKALLSVQAVRVETRVQAEALDEQLTEIRYINSYEYDKLEKAIFNKFCKEDLYFEGSSKYFYLSEIKDSVQRARLYSIRDQATLGVQQ